MRKKMIYGLLTVIFSVFVSACSGGSEGEATGPGSNQTGVANEGPAVPEESDNDEAAAKDADVKQTVVVYSANGARIEEYERDYVVHIEEALPHIDVQLITPRDDESKRIENLILAGTNIDLYFNSIGGFFSVAREHDLTYDLSEMINQNDIDLERFEPTLIDALTEFGDGEIWGLPVFTTAMTLYYNKDIFDQFAVPYLTDGMTWEEVYEVSRQLTRNEGSKQFAGIAISPSHSMQMNNLSLPFVDPETGLSTLDRTDEWRTVLEPLVRPAQEEGYRAKIRELDGKLPYSGEFNKTKDLAIFGIFHNWLINNENQDVNWDMVSYPTFEDGVGSQLYPTYYGIPKFAQNKEGAMEVLEYLTSDEFQMILSKRGEMPVVQTAEVVAAFGTESISKDRNLKAPYFNDFAPIAFKHPHEGTVRTIIQNYLVDIAMGNIDINTALRQAKEEADQELQTQAK